MIASAPSGDIPSAEKVSATSHDARMGRTSVHSQPENLEEELFQEPVQLPMKQVLVNFVQYVRSMGALRVLWMAVLSIFVVAGQGMQLIFLNYWLRSYPPGNAPGNYTTFFISSLLFSIFFVVWLVLYLIIKRPKDLRFMMDRRGWGLIFAIGTMDTVNSYLAIYSADKASEVLEAIFSSLTPPLTAALSRIILDERRNVLNFWFIVSMVLVIGGVLLASGYDMAHSGSGSGSHRAWWNVIYFLSIPPNVFLNCWQGKYMILFTRDENFEKDAIRRAVSEEQNEPLRSEPPVVIANSPMDAKPVLPDAEQYGGISRSLSHETHESLKPSLLTEEEEFKVLYPVRQQSSDTLVKLWMLVGDTTVQFLQTVVLLPADAIPWWGGSDTPKQAGVDLGQGFHSFFTYKNNFLYGFLYSFGFILTYIGSAYLNHHSVTLCSMVSEISSPLTALLLLIVPAINLSGTETPLGYLLPAIAMLLLGTVLYTLWDYSTEAIKKSTELELKKRYVETRVIRVAEKSSCTGTKESVSTDPSCERLSPSPSPNRHKE